MQKIITFIVGVIIIAGVGYYYYTATSFQNPLKQYEKIIHLPNEDQSKAFQATLHAWIKDPVSSIPYPKSWKKESVTTDGYTYDVVTLDKKTPPEFYASFAFPKPLISKMNVIKCIGTAKDKVTDICIVGDNAEINAYFTLMQWFNTNSIKAPTVNF